ncbi:MAG: discoidin domain-containing protein [Polyangiaceae bacterium]
MSDAAEGTLTVHLEREYDLTRVGLSIRRDFPGDARVYVSADGESWSEAIVAAEGRTHRAIEYFVLAQPARARHVKVVVSSAAPCDEEIGGACAFLNELELYSTIDSFENDPIGNAPRGYQQVTSSWVTDYETGTMGRALRIVDDADDQQATLRWNGAPRTERVLAFALLPLELPGGFLFDIEGVDDADAPVTSYHLAVFPDGSVQHYDFAAEKWTPLAEAGLVPVGSVSRIRVEASVTEATIFVGDEKLATVTPSAPGATALTAHLFSSSGTAAVGDQVLIDDVGFQ